MDSLIAAVIEPGIVHDLTISVIGGLILAFLLILARFIRSALSKSSKHLKKGIRGRRASNLRSIKRRRRDPAESAILSIKANTYFALCAISIGFYVAMMVILVTGGANPVAKQDKFIFAVPIYLFELLWLWSYYDLRELTNRRRRLFK